MSNTNKMDGYERRGEGCFGLFLFVISSFFISTGNDFAAAAAKELRPD